jgi:pimeloyl-ACP methyl ester carboxylesterase
VVDLERSRDDEYVARFGQPPRSLHVDVNGTRMHVLEWGEPSAPPVLLVHGMRAHARWFTPVGPALAGQYRALAVDLRGHGESAHTPPYGVAVYADDVAALINKLELTRPILLGHSMGGSVVAHVAIRLEARLRALFIVDAGMTPPARSMLMRSPEREREKREQEKREQEKREQEKREQEKREQETREDDEQDGEPREPAALQTFDQVRARFKLRPGGGVASPDLLDHLAYRGIERRADQSFGWRSDARLRDRAYSAPLPEPFDATGMTCPMISIWGEESPFLQRVSPMEIAKRFPNAAFTACEMIPGAYHHVFLDQPAAFNAVLLKHLASIPA